MTSPPAGQRSFGGRWTYGVILLALLFVLMPFLFWNATWFGRPMTEAQISKALNDHSHPREIQHALTQMEARMEAREASVRRLYPQLVALASDPIVEIRLTDAWVMGQDNTVPEFHRALLGLLSDVNPLVERNAALSLVRFGDASGHAVISSMLRPYDISAPDSGVLLTRLKPGDVVNPGTLLGRIETAGQSRELRSPVPGQLERWLAADKSTVALHQPIASIAPNGSMVWEALRALYLIGGAEDLVAVEPYIHGVEGMAPQIAAQAQLTASAIRARSAS